MPWNFALRGFTVCGLRPIKLLGAIPHNLCARATQRLLVVTSARMLAETAVGLFFLKEIVANIILRLEKAVLNDDYSIILGHNIPNLDIHIGQDDAIGHGFDNFFKLLTLDSDTTCGAAVCRGFICIKMCRLAWNKEGYIWGTLALNALSKFSHFQLAEA